MNRLTSIEFIEVFAAVSFRVLGFIFGLIFFQGLLTGFLLFAMDALNPSPSTSPTYVAYRSFSNLQLGFGLSMDIAVAALSFRFAVSLARLVARSMTPVLKSSIQT